eukprot:07524.XXX_174277_173986_1 [CDS] Oithona nana genome sequencing.
MKTVTVFLLITFGALCSTHVLNSNDNEDEVEDSPPCLDPTGLNCMLRRPKRSPEQAKLEHPDRECLDPTGIYCVPHNQA